jgi:2-phosphoglycolate phosphatase
VVFDLDGTLIDSRRDIADAANAALAEHALPTHSTDTIAGFIGDGARQLLVRASGNQLDEQLLPKLYAAFQREYLSRAVVHTTMYPGAADVLRRLSARRGSGGPRVALCTNKPRQLTERILALLSIEHHFEVVVAADDVPRAKPHPDGLLSIARAFALEPHELVMVGDGPQDIECGHRAGALTVGVSFGIASVDQMRACQPHFEVESFGQLLSLLNSPSR